MADYVHDTIEQLVAEEHSLWDAEAAGNGDRCPPAATRADSGRPRSLLGSPTEEAGGR